MVSGVWWGNREDRFAMYLREEVDELDRGNACILIIVLFEYRFLG
jgi:hypothetical protein